MQFPTMSFDGGLSRPIVPLGIVTPSGNRILVDALLDTGADTTLMSSASAKALGLNINDMPVADRYVRSPLGNRAQLRSCELWLELRRYPDAYRWKQPLGFCLIPWSTRFSELVVSSSSSNSTTTLARDLWNFVPVVNCRLEIRCPLPMRIDPHAALFTLERVIPGRRLRPRVLDGLCIGRDPTDQLRWSFKVLSDQRFDGLDVIRVSA